MQRYAIDVVFQTHNTHFIEMSRSNVLLFGDNNHLHVRFNLYAFGDFDLHYIATQKIHYLQMLLSVYTGNIYQLDNKCQVSHEQLENKDTEWDYDDDWIDSFCEQSGESAATLIPDFFDLFQLIIVEDCYSKNLRLVLNSIQDYYCALKTQQLIHSDSSYNIPGFVDSTNTLLISALEPLSCIGADSPETCPTCGNQVYKISERIRTLCTEYLGAELAKEIGRSGYGNRCSFLHEGNAKTNEFYCGVSVPLINPSLPNEIMNVSSCLEYNYFDYISYIIRKKIHDLLKSSLL